MAAWRPDTRRSSQRSSAICTDLVPARWRTCVRLFHLPSRARPAWPRDQKPVALTMRYISTRGDDPLTFPAMLLAGTAPDGGLYMPERWPQFTPRRIERFLVADYCEAAVSVLVEFVGGFFSDDEVRADVAAAYSVFDCPEVAPLGELDPGLFLVELFHGPTLAFKDIALQLMARFMGRELERRDARATILVATSGD